MSRLLQDNEIEMMKRFFDFDLSEEELKAFETKLSTNAVFAEEVDNYRLAYQTVDNLIHKNREDLISQKYSKSKVVNTQNTSKSSPKYWKWVVGLLILAALAFGTYYMTTGSSTTEVDEQIFAQADEYTRLMSSDILRGEDITTNITEEEKKLKDIIDNYKNDSNSASTIQALKTYITETDNITNDELAEWWLVNIYLQARDIGNAKQILQEIKENPNYNSSKKATEFLKGL